MERALAVLIGLLGACVVLGVVLVLSILKVQAHDWYPMECCHEQDCAPATVTSIPTASLMSSNAFVPESERALPSLMMVTTIHGSAIVPPDFKVRESPDGRAHACLQHMMTTGQMRLICLFLPPSM